MPLYRQLKVGNHMLHQCPLSFLLPIYLNILQQDQVFSKHQNCIRFPKQFYGGELKLLVQELDAFLSDDKCIIPSIGNRQFRHCRMVKIYLKFQLSFRCLSKLTFLWYFLM